MNAGDSCTTSSGAAGVCQSSNGILYCASFTTLSGSVSQTTCTSIGASCVTSSGTTGICQSAFGSLYCSAYTPSTPSPTTQSSGGNSSQSSGGNTGQNVTLINPLGAGTSLPALLNDILQFVVQIGSIIVIFMLVYVGFLFIVARGEPGKISEARRALLYTLIGALILLGAEAIALGIQATVQALSVGS